MTKLQPSPYKILCSPKFYNYTNEEIEQYIYNLLTDLGKKKRHQKLS